VLSALLTLTTLHPEVNVKSAAIVLVTLVVATLALLAGVSARQNGKQERFRGTPRERVTWTMPPLETIPPPAPSRARTIGLTALRVYVTIAALLLVVKAVQLSLGG
jgi:hypothetical protein